MGLECDVARTRTNHIRLMRDTLAVLDYMLDDVCLLYTSRCV